MKKEVFGKEKRDFGNLFGKFNKIFFIMVLFAVVVIVMVSVGGVMGQYVGPYPFSSSSSTATPGATAATTPTTPQFDANKPEKWFNFPEQAVALLSTETDKTIFFNGIKKLSNEQIDVLWQKILEKNKAEEILKLKKGSQEFDALWDKISWTSAAKTIEKLNSEQLQKLLGIMNKEQVTEMLRGAYSLTNKEGKPFTKDGEASKLLEKVRNDFLLEAYKYFSEKDKNDKDKKETNKFFTDLYKSFFKEGKLTEAGKVGLENLEKSWMEKGMEEVGNAFIKAVLQSSDTLKMSDAEKEKYKSNTGRFAGLEELIITNPDFARGFDKDGKIVLKYKGNIILDLDNAQLWANKIRGNKDGLVFEKSSDGTKITIPGSDFAKLKSMVWDKEGWITLNKDFNFNPYAKDDKETKPENWKLSISENKVVITGDQKVGWIRVGDKFFTYNRENPGTGFSVTMEEISGKVVSSAQNVDISVLLGGEKGDHWKNPSVTPKAISFRTSGAVPVYGVGEAIAAPFPKGIVVSQIKDMPGKYYINLNGINKAFVFGDYSGGEPNQFAINVVDSTNVFTVRLNEDQFINVEGSNFQAFPWEGGYYGRAYNPDPNVGIAYMNSRIADVLRSMGAEIPGGIQQQDGIPVPEQTGGSGTQAGSRAGSSGESPPTAPIVNPIGESAGTGTGGTGGGTPGGSAKPITHSGFPGLKQIQVDLKASGNKVIKVYGDSACPTCRPAYNQLTSQTFKINNPGVIVSYIEEERWRTHPHIEILPN